MIRIALATIAFLVLTIPPVKAEPTPDWFPITFTMIKDTVYAYGKIDPGAGIRFDNFVDQYDIRGKTVVLNSPGGTVDDALHIGRRMYELNVNTVVGQIAIDAYIGNGAVCNSMCPYLLLAGRQRAVPPGNQIGVHQISYRGTTQRTRLSKNKISKIEEDIGRLILYTIDMGGTARLVAASMSVPYWELKTLTRDELNALKLVTK